MDIQHGHPFSQHFYFYYYSRNKDQYIKGGMVGESWVNVSLQLFLFGGFSIKLITYSLWSTPEYGKLS